MKEVLVGSFPLGMEHDNASISPRLGGGDANFNAKGKASGRHEQPLAEWWTGVGSASGRRRGQVGVRVVQLTGSGCHG